MSRITLKQIICTPTYVTVIFLGSLSSFANAANLELPMSGGDQVLPTQVPNQIDLADLLGDGSTVITATYSSGAHVVKVSVD